MNNVLRRFTDRQGKVWEVWTVTPRRAERRFDRSSGPPEGIERRQRGEFRVNVGPVLAHGWLIFASGSQRRRYAPVPEHWWEQLSDTELSDMCHAAQAFDRQISPFHRSPGE